MVNIIEELRAGAGIHPEGYLRRSDKRSGIVEQLAILDGTQLSRRVEIVSIYFKVEQAQVERIVDSTRNFLTGVSKPTDEELEGSRRRTFETFFQSKMQDLGVSDAHAHTIILLLVDELALEKGSDGTEQYRSRRWELLNLLRQPTKSTESTGDVR